MNLKITCACGQKIAFEVEPENGQMPCPINCPACQADVTELANADIRRNLTPPAEAAPTGPRLRVSVASHAPAAAAPAVVGASAPAPSSGRPSVTVPPPPAPVRDPEEGASMGAFLLGTAGVLGGAVLGVVLWVLLAKMGLTMKLIAVLVGVGAGLGGRVFCREGDKGLGGVASVVAVIAMVFGSGLVFNQKVVDKVTGALNLSDAELRELYDEEVKDAKEIVAQIPRGTDQEIRTYLGKLWEDPAEVTAEDVQDFRQSDTFKNAKDMAAGKISFTTYAQNFRNQVKEVKEVISDATKEEQGTVAALGMLGGLRIWLIALVGGTAYKLAAG